MYEVLIESLLTRWPPANLVLQDTVERIYVQNLYADINRGIFLVRGENVLLLGEIVRVPYLRHLPTLVSPKSIQSRKSR